MDHGSDIQHVNGKTSQMNVPQTHKQRQQLLCAIREYVAETKPTAPLSMDELRSHSEAILKVTGLGNAFRDFAAVLLSNEVWRPIVAAISYHKRLLLLPKCLRDHASCPAKFDELGLLCENCGRCIIGDFKAQAEELGYAVLVAEGSPVVMSLIQTGKIEAVIGVSCLSVLERTFPYMEAAAVPGIAMPLLRDGCAGTAVDVDWLWEAIYESSDEQVGIFDLDSLRRQVENIFAPDSLRQLLSSDDSTTAKIALDWLAGNGKRWRPFLAVAAYKALAGNCDEPLSVDVCKTAVAVECFHKASLIHDDIEDGDVKRYGQDTMHTSVGVPVALNVGDFLLGEGYRLLAELGASPQCRVDMLRIAAQGHRTLCLGQGAELVWTKSPTMLDLESVIDIFRSKTSPAFAVALKLGATLAAADKSLADVIEIYSDALGIAYQIRDDIADYHTTGQVNDIVARRPSVLVALACEQADDEQRAIVESMLAENDSPDWIVEFDLLVEKLGIVQAARSLMQTYKSTAIGCLSKVDNVSLKALLRRVICRIFNDIEVMGCCNDHKKPNDHGSEKGRRFSG